MTAMELLVSKWQQDCAGYQQRLDMFESGTMKASGSKAGLGIVDMTAEEEKHLRYQLARLGSLLEKHSW